MMSPFEASIDRNVLHDTALDPPPSSELGYHTFFTSKARDPANTTHSITWNVLEMGTGPAREGARGDYPSGGRRRLSRRKHTQRTGRCGSMSRKATVFLIV